MRKVMIQISETVWKELTKRKIEVGDPFDTVLRRLLRLSDDHRARARPRIIPWTEITGKVLHVDVSTDSLKLAINMQKNIHITLPKGEIIKKPSIIEAGSSISILRTHSGYYIKTSHNCSPQDTPTKVDMG